MNKLNLAALSAAFCFAASGSAIGAMTKVEYKSAKSDLSTKYKADKAACKAMNGNAKDICIQEAKGQESVAKAELEQNYQPSDKHSRDIRIAKVDAAYAVAKEKCDDLSGNPKDVCRKEAKSAFVTGSADAKLAAKTADANSTAREKNAASRKDAAVEKRDAAYAVAKEKCDGLAGDAKDKCVKQAKATYGQN